MITPPLTATPEVAQSPGQAGSGQVDAIECPTDMTPRAMLELLRSEYGRGNLSVGRLHFLPGGQVMLGIVLRDGSAYKRPNKTRAAAEWMRRTRVLSRPAFFAKCTFSGNSADLHGRAIRVLARSGDIEKDHGVWVWEETNGDQLVAANQQVAASRPITEGA